MAEISPPSVDVRLLGPIEARHDGRLIALGAPQQRAVLAMLALQVGRRVSTDRLAEGLWGEQAPASAPKMVQLYVSQLRRLLDGDGAAIATRGRGYELQLTSDAVDAAEFEHLLEQGHARAALALWRGEALADMADMPFAAVEIRRLDDLRVRAAEEAIDADLATGRHNQVIEELEALIEEHPLRERLHAQRMLALYRAGRQAEALNAYSEARSVLVKQIGVEPGAELRRLQEAILAHDPALDLRSSPRSGQAARPPPRRTKAVLAIAAFLLVAGVAAFGISRLLQPDSLPRIDENHVGLIDSESRRITAQYPVGHGPEAVAVGAGSLWVANRLDGTVSRIPDTRGEVVTIEVGGEPSGLAFGAGSLWIADGSARTVKELDPLVNKVIQRYDVGNAAHALAVGSGAVWVASAIDATIVRIDLKTGKLSKPIGIDPQPTALAAGAGAIWVASEGTGRVLRLDPRSGTPTGTVTVGNGPSSVAVGAGAVWVANRRDGTLSRIDPATNVPETRRIGREPRAVVAGDDGVWVADGAAGKVLRIDPDSLRVSDTVDVASGPAGLALFDGDLWTAVQGAPATHRGGTLRVSAHTYPRGTPRVFLDPTLNVFPAASLVYDGLVNYRRAGGSAGGALVPGLATDLGIPSPDQRTWVFRLRPDIRFANGAPVTPEDVRASFERMYAFLGGDDTPAIRGAERCTVKHCDLSDAIETDPVARTVTLHLGRDDPEFLHKLHMAMVVPAGTPMRLITREPPPGTGPYRFAGWDGLRGGRLVRNPRFRGSPDRPSGFPDTITVGYDRAKTQVAAVERRAADIALITDGAGELEDLRVRNGVRVHVDPFPLIWYVFLNVNVPPFDNPNVRRALNYAVDRQRIAELLGTPETHHPSCQLLPPGLQGYAPSCPFTVNPNAAGTWVGPDLARARRLIAESGTRGMEVEFWGTSDGPWKRLAPYFRSLLQRLGYRATVRAFNDLSFIYDKATERRPQLGAWVWWTPLAGPYTHLQPIVSCTGETNLSNFCEPRIDAQMRQAAAGGPDAIERWQRVEASLAEQAPTVPLVNESAASLVAERVGNYQHHPVWGPLLEQMWVK